MDDNYRYYNITILPSHSFYVTNISLLTRELSINQSTTSLLTGGVIYDVTRVNGILTTYPTLYLPPIRNYVID